MCAWGGLLLKDFVSWSMGKETIVETSFYEPLKNVPRQKKPMENW
jgi:hypothetical protein